MNFRHFLIDVCSLLVTEVNERLPTEHGSLFCVQRSSLVIKSLVARREFSNLPDPVLPQQTREIILEFNYRKLTHVKLKSPTRQDKYLCP